nr:GNAT family N-acetyltransferase [Eubacterium sp.]
MNHKEMWKNVFGDSDKYTDFFFKEKAKRSVVYSKYDNDDLTSMAFFRMCPVVYRGLECVCPYIVGVATQKELRGKGYMRGLLGQGLADVKNQGLPVAFLSPADPAIYKSLGFEGMYYRKRLEVKDNQRKWYTAATFSRLDSVGKERVAEFAKAQLHASELDLYLQHDAEYYELLHKEMKSLGGKVIVLREGQFIRGVAAYIYEEGTYEVTEVICDPADGRKVMQSICAFLMERLDKAVVFDDSYFLGDVAGEGVRVQQMDKPYIMVKNLQEEAEKRSLQVYINDLT